MDTDWLSSRTLPENALDLCVFDDQCKEEQWYKIFADTIQPYHKLETLVLKFNWPELTENRWSRNMITRYEDQNTLNYWRENLLNFLHDHVRGIRKNRLLCQNDRTNMSENQLTGISMAMTRNRRTAVPRVPKKKLTLEEALRNVKLGRRREED